MTNETSSMNISINRNNWNEKGQGKQEEHIDQITIKSK